jgi:hypothetical protein
MENKKLKSIMQDALEKEISPAQIELWPAVKNRLVARKHPLFQQGQKMTPNYPRRAAFAALALVLAVVVLLATPQGQAFAKNLLNFFIRTEGNSLPVPMPTETPKKWVDVTPDVPASTMTPGPSESGAEIVPFAADCGVFPNLTCSVEAIRGKVNFAVKELGDIPENLYFLGATGGPERIFLFYNLPDNSGGLTITIEPWEGQPAPNTSQVAANAVVEKVKIRDYEGEYVKGSFVMDGNSNSNETVWNENFHLETLRWVEGDVLYAMQYYYPEVPYGKERLVALAESMTSAPVEKLPMPATAEPTADEEIWDPHKSYPFSISEMETQIGFKLNLPGKLPEGLALIGARRNPERNEVVQVYYVYTNQDFRISSNGLTISQQMAPNPADCPLCDIFVGDYNLQKENFLRLIAPPESNLQTVQIGDVTGKYVEGGWMCDEDPCGWKWDMSGYVKTLRWWKDEMAYELSYWGMELEKADLIAIAESMK